MSAPSSPITHHFEIQTRLTYGGLSSLVFKAVDFRDDLRLAVVAEPTGDWTARVLKLPYKLNFFHIATSPAEQTEAQRLAAETKAHERITWEVMKLPNQPNPALCRFDALLCGWNVTTLPLPEFFAWARAAVVPGGRLIITPELFRGLPVWHKRFTHYRRWRARYVDRTADTADRSFPTRDSLIADLQTAGFPQILVRGLHAQRRFFWSEYVLVIAR